MKFTTVVVSVALAAIGPSPSLHAAETAKLVATRDVWISSMPEEENFNMGAADQAKLKGIQEMAIFNFDTASLKGRTVRGGWLWLHNATAPEEVARYPIAVGPVFHDPSSTNPFPVHAVPIDPLLGTT
jgi:hypothetical protein